MNIVSIPLETINAVANTVTALAVLWAGRSLRHAMLEAARLTAQYRLSEAARRNGDDELADERRAQRRQADDERDFR